ncbi:acyltransferase family protein [Oceanobacter antarcticus]|uniref:Acyltransferase n=1 Tax=Oceanobacter antarcticus TaxID=3133425 RepID=A0ABW8NEF3_9GAMM
MFDFYFSVISILCCFFVSYLFFNSGFLSIPESNNRFKSIDGLRGFLAILVMLHHFVITYYWHFSGRWGDPTEIIYKNFGKVGVSMFFIITGFLFISKIIKVDGKVNWIRLMETRFFRIFPLYFLMVILISLVVYLRGGFEFFNFHDVFSDYLLWLVFLGGDINSFSGTNLIIAGVDWTLRYEWFFYLLLPLISFLIYRVVGVFLLFFAFLIFLFFSPVVFGLNSKYFVLFYIGGGVAFLFHKFGDYISRLNFLNSKAFSLFLVLIIYLVLTNRNSMGVFQMFLMGLLFFFIAAGSSIFGVLNSRYSILLGEISYSIYLLHGFVLYLFFGFFVNPESYTIFQYSLFMPVVALIVVFLSVFSFKYIESPFVSLGHNGYFSRFLVGK